MDKGKLLSVCYFGEDSKAHEEQNKEYHGWLDSGHLDVSRYLYLERS